MSILTYLCDNFERNPRSNFDKSNNMSKIQQEHGLTLGVGGKKPTLNDKKIVKITETYKKFDGNRALFRSGINNVPFVVFRLQHGCQN